MSAVEVRGLRKSYGAIEAVRGVDFDVARGETFGFLGPNGAGKSTTIKILCTLAKATGGNAKVAGFDVTTQRDDVRRHIGLVFQDTTLDTYLTAEQNLRFHAELYGMPKHTVAPRLQQVMEMVGLWERRGSKVMTFSGGMKRRLEIARGLMQVLLLPLSFLSGALYPLSNLPTWLNVVVQLNPLTYAVHPIRTAVFNHLDMTPEVRARLAPPILWGDWVVPTWLQLVIVAAIGALLMAVSIKQFQKVE